MERLLVCGDRNYSDQDMMYEVLKQFDTNTVIIHGNCKGADKIAGNIAETLGMTVLKFPALWEKYGRAAGPIRNKQMIDEGCPTLVIAFHKDIDSSKGTKNMIKQASDCELLVILYE